MKVTYIYRGFERFWHWAQALIIFLLLLTGFEIHSSYELFGYRHAVYIHNVAAWSFVVLIVFAIFWHFTSGEWRQYVPTKKKLKDQAEYYLFGIFKGAKHPVPKTELSKLNPLQRITYFGLTVILIPTQIITGVLYIFYRYPQSGAIKSFVINVGGLEIIAVIHTFTSFLLIAFIIIHLYLITTGHTLFSNLFAMISGYEELEEEGSELNELETLDKN